MNRKIICIKSWVNNILFLLFLLLVSIELYFRHIDRLSLSQDGFLLTYFMQTGDLTAIDVKSVKDPGRPFLGLGWQLASLFGGGSVSGYNAFMFCSLTLSATFIYFIVRVLIPRQPIWAFLVSFLKLIWSANYEIFDNSGLSIYFSEALFWLAFWMLLILITKFEQLSRFERLLSLFIMIFSLCVTIGTYQTSWPLILLIPLVLIFYGEICLQIFTHQIFLAIWYVIAFSVMFWCYILIGQNYINTVSPPLVEVVQRVLNGFWEATYKALCTPFAVVKGYSSYGITSLITFTTIIFSVFLVLFGVQSNTEFQSLSLKKMVRLLSQFLLIGIVIILSSLLLPSLHWEPVYGNRLMHWTAIGVIISILAILAAVLKIHPLFGGGISVIAIIIFVTEMMQQTYDVGNHYAFNGFKNRRFWEDLSTQLASIDEGTIVFITGSVSSISTNDKFSTQMLRYISETHLSFFITESQPVYDPINKIYSVSTLVDLDQTKPLLKVVRMGRSHIYSRIAKHFNQPRIFRVSANRVIWVKWNELSLQFHLISEQSEMNRIRLNIPSTYGKKLFPIKEIENNRTLANEALF